MSASLSIFKRIFRPSRRAAVYLSLALVLLVAGLGISGWLADTRSPDGPAADDISDYLGEGPLYPYAFEDGAWQVDERFFMRIHEGRIRKRHWEQLNDFQNALLYFTLREFKKASILFMERWDCPITTHYKIRINIENNHLNYAEGMAQRMLEQNDDPLLRLRALISLGQISLLRGDHQKALAHFQQVLQYDASHPLGFNGLGRFYSEQYNITGNQEYWEQSRFYYRQVDQDAFIRQMALLDGRYYRILLTGQRFAARSGELNLRRIRRFAHRQPLPDRLQILSDIWHYHVRYVPFKENFAAPRKSLERQEGDCSDYARYIHDLLRWPGQIRHLIVTNPREGRRIGHAFVVVFDRKQRTHYRLDVGILDVGEVSLRSIRRNPDVNYAFLNWNGTLRLRQPRR